MTTSQDPDQIRAEIEQTRANLSDNVNALTDTVTPSHIAKRQVGKARGAMVSARDKVMGTTSDLGAQASDRASTIGDAVTGAPSAVTSRTAGSPLAAGLIAVGVGWLVGSLMPASSVEKQAAAQVKDAAAPVVGDAAKEVADHLKQPAQDAVESVKETATSAMEAVQDEGASAAKDVQGKAADAKDAVQSSAS
jgi:hypothetical protein